jgi:hypothetical protein
MEEAAIDAALEQFQLVNADTQDRGARCDLHHSAEASQGDKDGWGALVCHGVKTIIWTLNKLT